MSFFEDVKFGILFVMPILLSRNPLNGMTMPGPLHACMHGLLGPMTQPSRNS
jgi:hypothetical protein